VYVAALRKNKKERRRLASLFELQVLSAYLSATNGNRSGAVKVKRKKVKADRRRHIGRYSMRVTRMRQGGIKPNMAVAKSSGFAILSAETNL
jgi:hypothetical protein